MENLLNDKNICQIQHKVGDAVWYLVKGTKRVKNKVRKYLPSYEGPYFVVGPLDDLVYRIKKSPRPKAKVVHHDKFKPYYTRTPLDNSWVRKDTDAWAAVEVSAPQPDADSSDTVIGPLNLWDTSSDTGDPAVEAPQGHSSSPLDTPSSSQLHHGPPQSQLDEAGSQHPARGPTRGPLLTFTPLQRPKGLCRAPNKFGDWVGH